MKSLKVVYAGSPIPQGVHFQIRVPLRQLILNKKDPLPLNATYSKPGAARNFQSLFAAFLGKL